MHVDLAAFLANYTSYSSETVSWADSAMPLEVNWQPLSELQADALFEGERLLLDAALAQHDQTEERCRS